MFSYQKGEGVSMAIRAFAAYELSLLPKTIPNMMLYSGPFLEYIKIEIERPDNQFRSLKRDGPGLSIME